MRNKILTIFLLIFGLVASSVQAAQEPVVYYLFELPKATEGCSDCYIPMFITDEEIKDGQAVKGTLLTTYERDSLWSISGEVSVEPRDIHAQSRQITINEKKYRYQQVAFSELEKILNDPAGTIPISRISDPSGIGEFQALKNKYLLSIEDVPPSVPVQGPSILDDLSVERFSFKPATPREGDTVTIELIIKNNSSSYIDGVHVAAVDQTEWGNGVTVNFAPGESKAVEIVIFAQSGHAANNSHHFTVKFTKDNAVGIRTGGTIVVKSSER